MVSARSILFTGLLLAGVGLSAGLGGCASQAGDGTGTSSDDATSALARDFGSHPAVLEIDDADQIFALSDPHGEYDALVALLAANHLVSGPSSDGDPAKVKWSGGSAMLVFVGDLIDKGPKSLDVIDLVRSLEVQAPKDGGRVIALMGNHEAEFLADPKNDKAMSTGSDQDGIDEELTKQGLDPKQLAAGTDKEGRGRWMAGLPLGVRVKKWFFSHAGNTQRLSIGDLKKKLESSIAHHGFGDKDITGNDSILESQQWYGDPKDGSAGQKEVLALGGVEHVVFGHDPGALGDDANHIRQSKNGLLVKIDCAMGLHEGHNPNPGYILHVSTKGTDQAEILDDKGHSSKLD